MKVYKNKIEELKIDNEELKFNCYRILYKDDKFNISFGNFEKENNRVLISSDINFSKNGFEEFLISMLRCIAEYEDLTGESFFCTKEGELGE